MTGNGVSDLFVAGDSVAVLGLGASGTAAARLVHALGADVYASDASGDERQRTAAEALRGEGIDAEAGGHDLDRIVAARLVVTSPGISPASEIRRALLEAGRPVVAEIEVAFRHLTSRIVAITGTNGKTTTTALCGHLMRSAGLDAVTAGNIGRPLSEVAVLDEQPDWVVVELSSFQLADLQAFDPTIGVLLNLAPDHLDRYASLDRYYADKARLFANATEDSRWVLNADDEAVMDTARHALGDRHLVSLSPHDRPGGYLDEAGALVYRAAAGEPPVRWTDVAGLRLVGRHNVMNALLAATAAAVAGGDAQAIGRGLESFEALPHRLQPVAELDGVLWVNDSKGTNVSATRVALEAFQRPLIALLGGRHKGEPYTSLVEPLERHGKAVIAYGEAAPQIVRELSDHVEVRVAGSLEEVVRQAAEIAEAGDVVLLSPACSSYDMFPNYEARGRTFEALVRGLEGGGG